MILFAVLQSMTLMIFQHSILAAETSLVERAIAYDTLRALFVVIEAVLYPLLGHGHGNVWGLV
jgi:hypothetical protein